MWRFDARGFAPLFSSNYEFLREKYLYWKRYLGPCSMRRVGHKEILKERYKLEMTRFVTHNVTSIAAACDDEELRREILLSDYIRNETLNRCMAIPSYRYKPLKWKNLYYDHMRKIVEKEMGI